jgi:hypothetical protein
MELKCRKYFTRYYQNIEKGNTDKFIFDGGVYYSFNKDVHRISGETFFCLISNTCVGFSEEDIFTFFYTEAEVRQQKISKVLGDE